MPRPLGDKTLRVLAAVRDGARYGLDIVERTDLPSGTVYPVLGRLRDRGLLESRWEDDAAAAQEGRPRRKYHRVTAEGARVLAEAAERLGRRVPGLDGEAAAGAGGRP